MFSRQLAVIAFDAMVVISALYAPQPLLPALTKEFVVSPSHAALLTTLAMLPLSVAPIAYGFVLESFPARRLLNIALVALSLSEVAFALSHSFTLLIVIRLFQGLLIPAILTSLTTSLATMSEEMLVQRRMYFYIAATILGGFLGRACSGFLSEHLGWRYVFLMLSMTLWVALFLTTKLQFDASPAISKLSPLIAMEVLKKGQFLKLFLLAFLSFFVFTSILNFLPFRLTEISDSFSEFKIGMMYLGYTMGLIVSLSAAQIVKFMGNEMRAITSGLGCLTVSVVLFTSTYIPAIFLAVFVLCGGMFLVHSVALGLLNKTAREHKAVANGLYISFYYAGGTLGSYFPGVIYKRFGWAYFVASLVCVLAVAIVTATSCRSTK